MAEWKEKGRDGGPRWSEMGRDGPRWAEMERDGPRWSEMGRDGARWVEMELLQAIVTCLSPRMDALRSYHALSASCGGVCMKGSAFDGSAQRERCPHRCAAVQGSGVGRYLGKGGGV